MSVLRFSEAINAALREELARDERVYLLGQDIGAMGGVYGVTRKLLDQFGPERVRDTPISETAIVGSSVGAALAGLRPVAEIQFADFLFVAMDEVVGKAAKWRYMHGASGDFRVPLVIRAPIGGYIAASAEHSESPLATFAHFPGLKVVVPSTPADAKGLLKSAIRDDNPVLFFEHKRLYQMRGEVPDTPDHLVPLGQSAVRRTGKDVTLVATALMAVWCLEIAEQLATEGIACTVIDLRTVAPLDLEPVYAAVEQNGRLVIVDEDHLSFGLTAEISARVIERCFRSLKAPPQRVAAADVPIPYSPPLEQAVLPSKERIIAAIRAVLAA
jgi:pyruvate/2-oxoglutarate/acetoin dehydrogenase E1 component